MGKVRPLEDRFWEKVDRRSPDECRLWKRAISKWTGYGGFTLGSKSITAHRASYLLFKGEIPAGLQVLHDCDVRACVNPAHLHVGTLADNMREMVERGRSARGDRSKGAENGRKSANKRRRTHCRRGHAYAWVRSSGSHYCKVCGDQSAKEQNVRRKALAKLSADEEGNHE